MIHDFKPTRDARKPVKLIADLDALISKSVGFKYLGKEFIIQPLNTENYVLLVGAYHDLQVLLEKRDQDSASVSLDDVYEAYHKLMIAVCPEISLEDIKQGTLAQLSGMLKIFIRHITGDTAPLMAEDPFFEKKKITP